MGGAQEGRRGASFTLTFVIEVQVEVARPLLEVPAVVAPDAVGLERPPAPPPTPRVPGGPRPPLGPRGSEEAPLAGREGPGHAAGAPRRPRPLPELRPRPRSAPVPNSRGVPTLGLRASVPSAPVVASETGSGPVGP